uniref:Uncharacterized protein n=1 Tax=Ciona savignyi TaxID=51511 RepID=H2ZKM8_CIOSA
MILTPLLICIGIVVQIVVGQITTGTNLSACASIVRSCQSQCATTTQEKYVQWDYTLGGQLSCELMAVAPQSQVTPKALADQPNNPFLITFKVQCCSRSPSGTINATKMGNQQCPRAIIPTVLQD